MAGAGQVGAALALLIKFRNDENFQSEPSTVLCRCGILGIRKPQIYGVTLPLFTPFLTSCLARGGGWCSGGLAGLRRPRSIRFGHLPSQPTPNVLY
jgi:phosphotransferase system  glucose/maltose/N-acetylglucosamine-specific IIC component